MFTLSTPKLSHEGADSRLAAHAGIPPRLREGRGVQGDGVLADYHVAVEQHDVDHHGGVLGAPRLPRLVSFATRDKERKGGGFVRALARGRYNGPYGKGSFEDGSRYGGQVRQMPPLRGGYGSWIHSVQRRPRVEQEEASRRRAFRRLIGRQAGQRRLGSQLPWLQGHLFGLSGGVPIVAAWLISLAAVAFIVQLLLCFKAKRLAVRLIPAYAVCGVLAYGAAVFFGVFGTYSMGAVSGNEIAGIVVFISAGVIAVGPLLAWAAYGIAVAVGKYRERDRP